MLLRACIALLVIGAMIIGIVPAFAEAPAGTGPGDAIDLAGVQVANLDPGKDKWYKFYDAGTMKPLGVEMHFSPASIDNNIYASFEVWVYLKQGFDWKLMKIGDGTRSDQPIGVKYWRGGDLTARNYYLRVYNNMPSTPIAYAFAFTGDQYMPPWLPIPAAAELPGPAPVAPITPPAPVLPPLPPPAPLAGGGASLATAVDISDNSAGIMFDQHQWYKYYHPGGDNPLGVVLNFQPRYLEDVNKNMVVSFNVWALICPGTSGGLGSGSEWMPGPTAYPTCGFKIIGRGTRSGLEVGVNYWRHTAPPGTYYFEVFNNSGQKAGYAIKALPGKQSVKDFPPPGLNVPMPPAP